MNFCQQISNFREISRFVEPRTGKLPLMGRYHKLPRKFSSEYCLTDKVLGTGCNGSVRMARSVSLKSMPNFAVKTFHTQGMHATKFAQLRAEIEIFLCMDHPHVARLVDVYESESSIDLVMECMDGGELFDHVAECKQFLEQDAAAITKQMLLAVNYVHSNGIVHRDLKLENFLFDTQGGTHLKLIDFGFSKFFCSQRRMRTRCGTLAYVAPEVLRKSYTSQCDLWSLGVIVFILLSGHMPFFGTDEVQRHEIARGHYVMNPEHWKDVSDAAQEFVCALLDASPSKRLTAKTALEHPWIATHCIRRELDLSPTIRALRSWRFAPRLLRACMCMMAWSLTNAQQARFRDQFLALDVNHDGAISADELKRVMIDKHDVPEEEVAMIFQLFDAHHSKQINYSDILAALACSSVDIDNDLMRSVFEKFDTTGAGYIAAQDFHDVLDASLENGYADSLVREADVHQVGLGMIDYEDFAEYVRINRSRMKEQAAMADLFGLRKPQHPVPMPSLPTLLGIHGQTCNDPFDVPKVVSRRYPLCEEAQPKNTSPCCTQM